MANDIEITLLAAGEYHEFQDIIPRSQEPWWLQTRSTGSRYLAGVGGDGGVYRYLIHDNRLGVRPALHIILNTNKSFGVGKQIRIGSKSWTILKTIETPFDEIELFVLCNEFIATRRFDPDSNDWKSSELKQWLETEGLKLIF